MAMADAGPTSAGPDIDPERLRIAQAAQAAFDFQRSNVGREETERLSYKLQRPLASVAKKVIREFGAATAGWRAQPDFLVIGAKRAGSTTLFRGLVDSGGIAPMVPARERRKGVYFFDVHHANGGRWYLGHMPLRANLAGRSLGEASPYYLSHPLAAARAAALIPNAKIVAVLRDPIERAHSHYRERCKQGVEYLPTFDDAIEAESERLEGEVDAMLADPTYVSWNHLNFGYLAQSRYASSMRRWFDAFDRDQILVLRAEDLYRDPARVVNEVRSFIGLETTPPMDVAHHNKLEPGRMSEATVAYLKSRLVPEVRQLQELVGRDMGWTIG